MIVYNMEQGSQEWHDLRCGKVTGSRLKCVFSTTALTLIDELIAEAETGQADFSDFISDDMQRGKDLEPIGLKEYSRVTGTKLTKAGFIQSAMYPLLGMSPDSLVYRKKKCIGAIEVKCPKSKNHVKYIRQNQIPNDYKWQTLSPFIISETIQWVDFVSYDPRIARKPIFIHRTTRESVQEELNAAHADLKKFFEKLDTISTNLLF